MLTVDLIRARRSGGELKLQRFDNKTRARALRLAEAYLDGAKRLVGHSRGELDEALGAVPAEHRDRKLALGLRKLVEDRCVFAADERVDPRELRRALFERAALARRELLAGEWLDRQSVVDEVALERGVEPEAVDGLLYSDLPERHILEEVRSPGPEALVDGYPSAEAQAVLLRATHVAARVRCSSAGTYRQLFRKLKFRRLLHTIHRLEDGAYRIDIDGPMSLFTSMTRYGLQLALVLPAIEACDEWAIDADLLWGRDRRRLAFRTGGRAAAGGADEAPRLPDDVEALRKRFAAMGSDWTVRAATAVLELPGVGTCIPDLRFAHPLSGTAVYLEVLGFWSRDAVWKRVELIEKGLDQRIIFAVPKRLRVSEEVLDADLPGELYVYAQTMSPKAVLKRLDGML